MQEDFGGEGKDSNLRVGCPPQPAKLTAALANGDLSVFLPGITPARTTAGADRPPRPRPCADFRSGGAWWDP